MNYTYTDYDWPALPLCAEHSSADMRVAVDNATNPALEVTTAASDREPMEYDEFLAAKALVVKSTGVDIPRDQLHPSLKDFQRDLTYWSLRKGRAALFADTGLGKTLMQLVWAQHAADRVLILAPLSVAQQTVDEGIKWGITVTYARSQSESPEQGITITNYEMLHHFDPSQYGAVVLDESSILKSFEGKTRTALIEAFANTPRKLCASATPSPNDITEIANHAEFLGVMSRVEMLATFFVHDDQGWRLKGHAKQAFYKWLASWGMSVRKPSDLGYSDEGYNLPGLTITPVIVDTDWKPEGQLFATELKGIQDRAAVRRQTLDERVKATADIIAKEPAKKWLIWCGLNDESIALVKAIPNSIVVEGSQSPEEKANTLHRFAKGEIDVLITKPSIAGQGMNFQVCSRTIFCGIGDSYEDYYQCIRRFYRFGQTEEVQAYIVLSEPEQVVYDNVLRKEREAQVMSAELVANITNFEREEIQSSQRDVAVYRTDEKSGDNWRMLLGDSTERLKEMEDNSIDLSIFSPPFSTLFTYSNSDRDLGNSKDYVQFFQHFGYISRELLRVVKPGRNVCVHVQQLPTTKATDGVIGMRDFRGDMIAHFVKQGFIYHGEICIDKNPQQQAIRTHSKSLLFVQLRKDASWMRPAFADYILVFRKPGDNAVPVITDLTNEEWIEFARPIWYGIQESDTLNAAAARSEADERHIAPLQLGTIERCVRLWSNKGETILTPFGGIGSELYGAVKHGRKAIGIELKPEYFTQAVKNLTTLEKSLTQVDLFAFAGVSV